MSEQSPPTQPPAPVPPTRWTAERFGQLIVLLLGGGLGGIITSLATNTLEWKKLTQQSESQNALFVDKYLSHVIDKDIHVRFRIAEYFSFVLESEKQRKLWKNYHTELETNYTALNNEYFTQLKALDPGSDEVKNFQANRQIKRIESYLGEARDLKIVPTVVSVASPGASADQAAAAQVKAGDYQVFTQFAGVLAREQVKTMMDGLAKAGWNMQGLTGGGERTPAAAGLNEIRYGALADQAAADELAKAVQNAGLTSRSVIASYAPRVRPKTLEIWISK